MDKRLCRWVDGQDTDINPFGTKGIGEIGITGAGAAVANVVFNAARILAHQLHITPDRLLNTEPHSRGPRHELTCAAVSSSVRRASFWTVKAESDADQQTGGRRFLIRGRFLQVRNFR